MHIENVFLGEELISFIVRSSFSVDGLSFLSAPEHIQQFGLMRHRKSTKIQPHIHTNHMRVTYGTCEVLYIASGKVRIDYYNNDKEYITSKDLLAGDWVVLLSHGHGFEMIEDSLIYEIKNGPYAGNLDKIKFSEVAK